MKLPLVERDVEVESGVDRSCGEIFSNNIGVRRHSGVADSNCVQGLQGMNETEGLAILLEDTKPSTVVRRGGGFVNT